MPKGRHCPAGAERRAHGPAAGAGCFRIRKGCGAAMCLMEVGRFEPCSVEVGSIEPGERFSVLTACSGVAAGPTAATGLSPLAGSRPTSRRGQAKSSARPAGGASDSPLTSVRAASASTAAGREPAPPRVDRCRRRRPPTAGSAPPADAARAGRQSIGVRRRGFARQRNRRGTRRQ